ncbi:MAG TPA: Zn-dependent alcohol dehydrogenase [Chloroflexi bacterium]|nr:Zn-dependent alcohol dehydrogenase [Chloroflexota bacterium]
MSANQMMRRAVVIGPRQVELEELPLTPPGLTQVLVRVRASALCTFEQRAYLGADTRFYPLLGGHELAGVVEAVGPDVASVAVGDKVAISAIDRCGNCYSCRRGYDCDNLWFKKPGAEQPKGPRGPAGLATHKLAEEYQIYKLRPETNLVHAALTEPLACVLRSIKRAQIQPGESAVIVGAGVMGILHLILAKGRGASVIVSEPHARRRQEALAFGATHTIDPTAGDFASQIRALTNGRGADVIVIATTAIKTVADSIGALAKGGRLLIYSRIYPKGETIALDPNLLHDNEIVLTGTISQSREDFQQAAEMIGSGAIDLQPIISVAYPLEEVHAAFESSVDLGTYRVVVTA